MYARLNREREVGRERREREKQTIEVMTNHVIVCELQQPMDCTCTASN